MNSLFRFTRSSALRRMPMPTTPRFLSTAPEEKLTASEQSILIEAATSAHNYHPIPVVLKRGSVRWFIVIITCQLYFITSDISITIIILNIFILLLIIIFLITITTPSSSSLFLLLVLNTTGGIYVGLGGKTIF